MGGRKIKQKDQKQNAHPSVPGRAPQGQGKLEVVCQSHAHTYLAAMFGTFLKKIKN